jgi:transcriptional regulator with GAF, ATPase, and Fis domain
LIDVSDTYYRWLNRRHDRWPSHDGTARAIDRLAPPAHAAVLIKLASEPHARSALQRELELLTRFPHPAFPRLLAAAHSDPALAIVLEFIALPSITSHLASQPNDAPRVAADLFGILEVLHAAGVVHGDLKPEHVLVGPEGVRLLDLGLSAPLGATPRGGTHGFLPPEYLRGAPLSVAGDLFALGATLQRAVQGDLDRLQPRVAQVVRACVQADPRLRPASAGAAAAALGLSLQPTPSEASLAWFGATDALDAGAASLRAADGGCTVVRGPAGSGRTRLVSELVRASIRHDDPVTTLTLLEGHNPFGAWSALLDLPASQDSAQAAAVAGSVLASQAHRVIVDDADHANEDTAAAIVHLARACRVRARGAVVVVGAKEDLATWLVREGARDVHLPRWSEEQLLKVLTAHGARSDRAIARVIAASTSGRSGLVMRGARVLARQPELMAGDLEELIRGWLAPVVEAPDEDALDAAQIALDSGAPRKAARLLRRASEGATSGRERAELMSLLGQAEARAGRLVEAESVLGSIPGGGPMEARLERARVLERLGRHDEACREALALLQEPRATVEAATIAATASLALGKPEEADELAVRGLSAEGSPSTVAKLTSIRSDAALRRGDAATALEHGLEAVRRAREHNDKALLAHTVSRVACARSLAGQVVEARDDFAAALANAEQACEAAALPPYLMNLATAEHRLGELGDAIVHYERAARMAERLGRAGTQAAALANLGGLLASVGAVEEAERVIEDASVIAASAHLPVYSAQITMTRAELESRRSATAALPLARSAVEAFSACSNDSGACEARLIEVEITRALGDRDAAERMLDSHFESFVRAGLDCRAKALRARIAVDKGDLEVGRVQAEAYFEAARDSHDRDDQARALHLLGTIHQDLGTGAADTFFAQARQCVGELAARLPPGLRARFLSDPARARITKTVLQDRHGPSMHHRPGLDVRAKRILTLVQRVLLEPDELRVLESAVDEAVSMTGAERAFLLGRKGRRRPKVEVARNLDRETIRNSRFRFSRSVAEQVLDSGEPLLTASATEDPSLQAARSVLDLGLRSILCVPIRGPSGIAGALYLDHRFEAGHFQPADLELVQSLADVIGVALENARLHRDAADRAERLSRAHEALRVDSVRKDAELERLHAALAQGVSPVDPPIGGIVGSSTPLRRALDMARRVAGSDLPVLVQGESGTGKELFARFVHERSRRATGPFVAINCGAMPESLIESELFGHVRGAFTGALRDHEGLFRAASGGTLLLDEIGEMSPRVQTRLLRVLQDQEVRPVGGHRSTRVDVRVLTATNRNLEAEVEQGRFRQDLFFRVVGAVIQLPPLRDRRDDIPALALATLGRIAKEPGMRELPLGRAALGVLLAHDWPGNVRELEHCLRRAVAVAEGKEIEPSDLGLSTARAPARTGWPRTLSEELVREALRASDGNRTQAARALGVSRVTLHRWIAKHDIQIPARPGRPRGRA